ncbi:MAG: DNA polymerase-3 subunit gamma/tau [Moritella sp.]
MVAGDANACMAKIAEVSLLGPDYDQLHVELASLLHRIAMAQILPSSASDTAQAEQVKALCELMSPEDVQLYYQITLTGRKELPLAPDPRSALEMTLLRILAFRPQGRLPQPEHDVTPAPANPILHVAGHFAPNVLPNATPNTAVDSNAIDSSEIGNNAAVTNTAVLELMPSDTTINSNEQPASEAMNNLNTEQSEIMQAAAEMGHTLPATDADSLLPAPTSTPQTSEPVTQTPVIDPLVDVTAEMPSPAADSSTVQQGRTTRNFLRSRLGSTVKKSTAAKSEQAPSSQYVPPKKAVKPVDNNVSNRFHESVSGYAASAPSNLDQAGPAWQELPPLEAYHDQGQVVTEPAPQRRQTERFSQVAVDINDLSPAFQPQKNTQSTHLPVMDNKLRDETDPWCRYINQMELGGRVRQMALHSVMEQQPGRILLTMNPDQRYFANEKSKQQLKTALEQVLSESIELEIRFGEDPEKTTPAQIEEKIYQQRLANATKNLYDDKYIQFFINRLGAVVDDSSIVPA